MKKQVSKEHLLNAVWQHLSKPERMRQGAATSTCYILDAPLMQVQDLAMKALEIG